MFTRLAAMALFLALASSALAAEAPEPSIAASEKALAGRILAPCCWNQTLDIHGSETSQGLRREIRKRLHQGETAAAIEADIVARYGERILAVPEGSPLATVAALILGLVALAGVAVVFIGIRWRRRGAESSLEPSDEAPPDRPRDELDERLDAELREQHL